MDSSSPPEKVGEIKKWLYVIKADFPQILTILVIAIPIIWLTISFLYKSASDAKDAQLATKEEQIRLAERQRDDFKAKTGTSTPDEAKAKIDALTAQVEGLGSRVVALEPRRLKASERDEFGKNARLLQMSITQSTSSLICHVPIVRHTQMILQRSLQHTKLAGTSENHRY
jgi:hypothetical protein